MLSKLLKYDLKYMIKNMSVFYILTIFFSIITRLLSIINNSIIFDIIYKISVGCMFSMIFSIIINTMMRSWVRFRDSIYKDEAYLTHTLPVTKFEIYNSKLIQALIFLVVGFVIVIISLFVAYYTKENWVVLRDLIKKITTGLNFNTLLFVISFVFIVFLEIFNAIQCGFFGVIIGYKYDNNKILYSILYGFIAYLLSQSTVLLITFISGLFNPTIMNLFKSNILLDNNSIKLLTFIATISYIFIISLMSIVCKAEFKKGVNIE